MQSCAIMTHPVRRELCERLVASLLPASVRALEVVKDDGRGCWSTARRAWAMGDLMDRGTGDTWHIVIQDDAIPCRDFFACAQRALSVLPADAHVTSFYWQPDRTKDHDLIKHDGHWLTFNAVPGAVCLAMRSHVIREFIQWADERFTRGDCDADDTRISAWMISTGRRCWVTLPSLVDHRHDVPSISGHDIYPFPRKAARFVGMDSDDSGIDWTKGLADPPYRQPNHPARFLQFCTGV